MFNWFNDEANRALVYNTAVAAGAIVIFYGLATQEEVAVWVGFVLALTNGLARANTTRK